MKVPALYKPLLPLLLSLLAACEQLGTPDPAKEAGQKEAEGKAIGGACRHAGRALEDCYALNPGGPKASIFAGWKEMNDYMAENKIDTVKPELPPRFPMPNKKKSTEEDSPPASDESAPAPSKSNARRRLSFGSQAAH